MPLKKCACRTFGSPLSRGPSGSAGPAKPRARKFGAGKTRRPSEACGARTCLSGPSRGPPPVERALRNRLSGYLADHPDIELFIQDLLSGGPPRDPPAALVGVPLSRLRTRVLRDLAGLGGVINPPGVFPGVAASTLQPAVIRALSTAAGDPDHVLADWLEQGAPWAFCTLSTPRVCFSVGA